MDAREIDDLVYTNGSLEVEPSSEPEDVIGFFGLFDWHLSNVFFCQLYPFMILKYLPYSKIFHCLFCRAP